MKTKLKSKIWGSRSGKLDGRGYLKKNSSERQKLLRSCVNKHGYRSCLGSITILQRNKNTNHKYKNQLESNSDYLTKTYGGVGSYGAQSMYKKHCKTEKKITRTRTKTRHR